MSGPEIRCFLEKVAKSAPQRVLIEIARPHDIEAGGLERLGDQAPVVGGRSERSALIGGVADDKSDARFGAQRAWRKNQRQQDERKERASTLANLLHD